MVLKIFFKLLIFIFLTILIFIMTIVGVDLASKIDPKIVGVILAIIIFSGGVAAGILLWTIGIQYWLCDFINWDLKKR